MSRKLLDATFFSHWPVFLFSVKAVQEMLFSNLPPPVMKKKKILNGSSFISIFIFCKMLNFNIFIRSNVNGNLTDDKN